jgi:hypothetical protein
MLVFEPATLSSRATASKRAVPNVADFEASEPEPSVRCLFSNQILTRSRRFRPMIIRQQCCQISISRPLT